MAEVDAVVTVRAAYGCGHPAHMELEQDDAASAIPNPSRMGPYV